MPTPAKQWRKIYTDVPLPSGNQADLRKPDFVALLMTSENGEIPTSLRSMVIESLRSGGKTKTKWQISEDELPALYTMVKTICKAAFVRPRIVETPNYDNDEISMDDIDIATDGMWVFNWGMPSEVGQAGKFLGAPPAGVDAASGVQPVRDSSVPDGGAEQ